VLKKQLRRHSLTMPRRWRLTDQKDVRIFANFEFLILDFEWEE